MDYNEKIKSLDTLSGEFLCDCQQLVDNLPCDFAGVALQNYQNLDITWPYVAGNRNEKYRFLTVRYGKGIAGKVISSGSPMSIEEFPNNIIGKSTEYPIMLAEKLISAYAYPLLSKGLPKGALLIGYRNKHEFTHADLQQVKQTANKVESLLPSYFGH